MTLRHAVLAWLLLVAGTAAPAAAGAQAPPCHQILCAPSLDFWTALNHSHLFGGPRVEMLPSGTVESLAPANNLELEFLSLVPTYVRHLSAYVSASWLPSATASANPYTEYTAGELGAPVRAPALSLGLGATYDVVTPAETAGWLTLSPYLGDLFGPAQQPSNASAYTHKLDMGVTATLHVFAWEPKYAWAHNLSLVLLYDYRATGLPAQGDTVPAGKRLFLTSARPSTLIAGLSIPLAPLHASP